MSNEVEVSTETTAEQDQATQKYYDSFLDIFSTDGWKNLLAEHTILRERVNSVHSAKTVDELWFNKGQLHMIEQLLSFERTIGLAIDSLAENPDEDN
tara:strand:+ start:220 stop:510 length:291 start_codon:yes stop_codon:yes gene_type:complete